MLLVCHRYVTAVLLLFHNAGASTITSAPRSTQTAEVAPTCEFRTINYITDSLPQQCLRSSWSHSNATSATSARSGEAAETIEGQGLGISSNSTSTGQDAVPNTARAEPSTVESISSTSSTTATVSEIVQAEPTDLESGELNEASFLSFEEWKKQTLDKAGQTDSNIGKRKPENKKRDSESIQNNLDSFGDEGEINLDFVAFRSEGKAEDASKIVEDRDGEAKQDGGASEKLPKKKGQYRSNDAGITCKERFSYASFDAGATILKTHAGAKNSKAVLIENKDSYMLSECSHRNKFIIIELSEDIWIDTVVLANYEFFSSMIRTFRVSVSDRYPVKIDKWKDIGTYEARNSREIQAFLIENPQIWARYIRIEFLSHFGNEYYCPLSLVRVHGTRMLESWKETEANSEDEDNEEVDTIPEDNFVPEAVAEVVKEEVRLSAELKEAQAALEELNRITDKLVAERDEATNALNATAEQEITLWEKPGFYLFDQTEPELQEVCLSTEAPLTIPKVVESSITGDAKSTASSSVIAGSSSTSVASNTTSSSVASIASQVSKPISVANATSQETYPNTASTGSSTSTSSEASISSTPSSSVSSPTAASQNGTSTQKKTATSTSSSSTSLPTIQESFFNAVSRRLQLLETNSTLSLKYIEEQSKMLREAFTKVEKKQLQKSSAFIETLNNTVLAELRTFRQQYDEIWQSTIISLESQREESRREILAVSTRNNILAEEVVFQRRMSIVQSILLILCLALVIFSRVSGGNLDFQFLNNRARNYSGFPVETPFHSPSRQTPEFERIESLREEQWEAHHQHRRQTSDDTATGFSRSRSRESSPPTPISTYSRDEEAGERHEQEDLLTPTKLGSVELSPLLRRSDGSYHSLQPSISEISSYGERSQPHTPLIRAPSVITRQQPSPAPSMSDEESTINTTRFNANSHNPPITILTSPPALSESSSPPLSPLEPQLHTEWDDSVQGRPRGFSIARKPLPSLPAAEED